MKKLILLAIGAIILVYACTKTTPPAPGSLFAAVNGVADTFNINILALKDSSAGTYRLSVVGFKSDYGDSAAGGFESAELGFQITSTHPVTAGTYTTDSVAGNQLTMLYLPSNTLIYDTVVANPSNPLSVVITKISATSVQGTFSGFAFYTDSIQPVKAVITNANFDATFPQHP